MRRWLFMARYARPEGQSLGLVLALVLTNAGVEALKPWPLKLVLDSVLGNQPLLPSLRWITALPGASSASGLLAWLTTATVVLFLTGSACRMLQSYVQAGAGARMSYHLGADLFEHIQLLSLRFHGRNKTGDLMQRILTDASCVRQFVSEVAMPLITSVATLAAMFGVMWRLDSALTALALLAAPPLLLASKWLARPMELRSYEQSELEGQMMAMAEQTLTAIPIVQAFTREPHEDRRFGQLAERTNLAYLRCTVSELRFKVATQTVTALGTAGIMLFGGLHVIGGRLSIGTLLVFLSYLAALYSPMEAIAYLASGYALAAAGARRVLEIMNEREEVREAPHAADLPTPMCAPRIAFHDVSFGYLPGRVVLNHITLEIEPGETVALVGATGCGKSTLVSLIPRLFDPWSGTISWDGKDLGDLRLSSLRARVAVVLQDPYLFPVTVAENIAYGKPTASRDEIMAAAVAAQADEFIRGLPQGYDTIIGERGATLSGGEHQRIAIARAFLKDAPLLLLDEPTAALDAQTEAEIVGALERLMHGRTTLIVAHRLSTVRNADRIFVMDGGTLVESGSELQLLEKDTLYRRLHSLQFATASGAGKA